MSIRTKIVFDNGDTLEIPEILTVGAGWVLRPDEARTSEEIRTGTNKSFGRSSEGREEAYEWLAEYLNNWMTKRGWPKPLSTDRTTYVHSRSNGGMNILFKSNLGFNQLTLNINEGWGSRNPSATIQWTTQAIQAWILHQHISEDMVNPFKDVTIDKSTQGFRTKQEAFKVAEAFSKDPIKAAIDLGVNLNGFPHNSEDLPPLEWPQSETVWLDDAETISLYCDEEHTFYRDKKYSEKVFTDSYGHFEQLQKAFKHLGVEFRVRQSYDYNSPADKRGYYISEVSLDIPGKRGDEHNERGHTIKLTTSGASVECGYRKDEEKWMEYEKRKAADWLQDMEELITPTKEDYEDYDYKPTN